MNETSHKQHEHALLLAVVLLLTSTAIPAACWAECAPINPLQGIDVGIDTIRLAASGDVDNFALAVGSGSWNGCQEAQNERMPSFTTSGGGDLTISVIFNSGSCPVAGCGCGFFLPNRDAGILIGGTIQIFDRTNAGTDCVPTLHQAVAHELGHVLGLDDTFDPACATRVMARFEEGVLTQVTAADCSRAEGRWVTTHEFNSINPDPDPTQPAGTGPALTRRRPWR